MRVQETIKQKLTDALAPVSLRVVDESHRHAGHAGASPAGETHFHVEIVSAHFTGQSRVTRQRKVYEILKDELAGPVHALSIVTRTPDEPVI